MDRRSFMGSLLGVLSFGLIRQAGAEASDVAFTALPSKAVEAMRRDPDALWFRCRAICADVVNSNGDMFPREEILKSYSTFVDVPVFSKQEGDMKIEDAVGGVVAAEWNEEDKAVECICFVDRLGNEKLCRGMERGYIHEISMGTQVDYSVCAHCGNSSKTSDDYCYCICNLKNEVKFFERNYGLKFIQLCIVKDSAWKGCRVLEILNPKKYLGLSK